MSLVFQIILSILVHVLIDLNLKPSMTLRGQTSLFRKSLSYKFSRKIRSTNWSTEYGKMPNQNFKKKIKNWVNRHWNSGQPSFHRKFCQNFLTVGISVNQIASHWAALYIYIYISFQGQN